MPPAYYNEFDPFAAAWLRNLIRENLIDPGDVDERSILDVKPGRYPDGHDPETQRDRRIRAGRAHCGS